MTNGTWTRCAPLDGSPAADAGTVERWTYEAEGGPRHFPVEVRVGKELDVVALKGFGTDDVLSYASHLEGVANELYRDPAALHRVERCPACDNTDVHPPTVLTVFDVPYVACSRCGHGYVGRQPTTEALRARFADSTELSAVYVDPTALDVRMRQVVAPKADWVLDVFQRRFGRPPRTAVDVGAGGGHFVAEMQRRGVETLGFEASRSSRAFAEEAFGITLRRDDVLAADLRDVELVTFWGMLEYAQEPATFVSTARSMLPDDVGMVVAEVPRLRCVGTAVQGVEGAVVARHMDPTSHVNGFTDSSLATMFVRAGLAPAAAWYFGMDAFEFVTQSALRSPDAAATFQALVPLIEALQAVCDAGRVDDDLVMAAVVA